MIPRKNKVCLLFSSQHIGPGIMENSGIAEINAYYNATKGGVDTVDKLVSHYSSKRQTARWPMVVFFNLIDLAGMDTVIKHVLSIQYIPSILLQQSMLMSLLSASTILGMLGNHTNGVFFSRNLDLTLPAIPV
jgi:hypothetical protein